MILPALITRSNIWRMGLLCGVVFLFGYMLPNNFHLYTPQYLPLTEVDRMIPLAPWTIYIYISEYILFTIAYVLYRTDLARNKYVWAYCGTLFVAGLFYVFYPVAYPRHDFPLPEATQGLTRYTFEAMRWLDKPTNCFPSMHVCCCLLAAFGFFEKGESRIMAWVFLIWAIAIGLSTLPTKQHYAVDVLGGLALALAGYWVFFKRTEYVSTAQYRDWLIARCSRWRTERSD